MINALQREIPPEKNDGTIIYPIIIANLEIKNIFFFSFEFPKLQ